MDEQQELAEFLRLPTGLVLLWGACILAPTLLAFRFGETAGSLAAGVCFALWITVVPPNSHLGGSKQGGNILTHFVLINAILVVVLGSSGAID